LKFCEKLKSKIDEKKYNCTNGLIKYYNENKFNGKLGVFCKSDLFKHQNEFRVFIKNNSINPLILKIGSLKEFSKIYSIEELENIRFNEKEVFKKIRKPVLYHRNPIYYPNRI